MYLKHLQAIIESNGGLAATQQKRIRIENPPYMRLVIEVVGGPFDGGVCEVSVAHYGEQNGDPMRDPEMTFLVAPSWPGMDYWCWIPLTYLNDYAHAHIECAEYSVEGGRIVRLLASPKLLAQHFDFALMWHKNIEEQGFLARFAYVQKARCND